MSTSGVIEDFVVGSAAPHDARYGEALLSVQGAGNYLGDKGFIFKQEVREDLTARGINLTTPQRRNMQQTTTKLQRYLLRHYRRIVETVNGQLTEHFSFDRPGGKSERGLLCRLQYKLAAHTVGLAILRQFHLPPMALDILTGLV